MSEGEWTKGPWRISGAAEGAGVTISAKRNTLIAFVRDNQHPLTDVQEHEATANARLIASAPSLVEALEAMLSVVGRVAPDVYAKAEAALKLAKGDA